MIPLSLVRKSLTAQITLWVTGFAIAIMGIVVFLMSRLTIAVDSNDVMGHRFLMLTAFGTAVAGLAVLSFLTWRAVNHHLHPLDMLAASAQRIANGDMESSVADSSHDDEVGQLQNSFSKMQRTLAGYIAEMEQRRDELNRQNTELEAAYAHAREADGVKTLFLSRMTAQMGDTVEAIDALTTRLCDHHAEMSKAELMKIQIDMLSYSDTVTRLLDQMIKSSKDESGNVVKQ